jgi:hypothetical protein
MHAIVEITVPVCKRYLAENLLQRCRQMNNDLRK